MVSEMLMNLPFTLPSWMPDWLFLLLALPVLLYTLAFFLMPFSVFGVKSRLESLEGQIDALHDELRLQALRNAGVLPRSSTDLDAYEDVPNFQRLKTNQRTPEPPRAPPAPVTPVVASRARAPAPPALPPRPGRRMEPRLD
jgi:hypothetical protein